MTDPFAPTTAQWPTAAQTKLAEIRALILDAARRADIGPVTESLKWHQPAWRPVRPRTGSTLRLDWSDKSPQTIALFVDCKTTLAAEMFAAYPDEFTYESNRAMRLDLAAPLPEAAIKHLATVTLTYHRKP